MEALIRRLQEFHVVEPLAVEAIEAAFTELTLPKYELLVEQGKTCRHLYFLEKGALRGFYTLDGKESRTGSVSKTILSLPFIVSLPSNRLLKTYN